MTSPAHLPARKEERSSWTLPLSCLEKVNKWAVPTSRLAGPGPSYVWLAVARRTDRRSLPILLLEWKIWKLLGISSEHTSRDTITKICSLGCLQVFESYAYFKNHSLYYSFKVLTLYRPQTGTYALWYTLFGVGGSKNALIHASREK